VWGTTVLCSGLRQALRGARFREVTGSSSTTPLTTPFAPRLPPFFATKCDCLHLFATIAESRILLGCNDLQRILRYGRLKSTSWGSLVRAQYRPLHKAFRNKELRKAFFVPIP
jgi:hypothetical protein